MTLETLEELSGILMFVVIAVCIASIFGFRFRRPKGVSSEAVTEHEAAPSEERPHADRATFRDLAAEKLEPLLDALVARAREHNCVARYEVLGEVEATTYRLEVTRPDHAIGQPLPYMTFSAGDGGLVEYAYGGVFPGPSDHNKLDPEIGWRTIRWDQVDDVIRAFGHKVFAHFD